MNRALRARSINLLLQLDRSIRDATGGSASFDDVVRDLARRDETLTTPGLRSAVERVSGRDFEAFFDALVFESARP